MGDGIDGRRPSGGRPGRRAVAVAFAVWVAAAVPTAAQDEVVNFRKPILVVETGGHHAPIRSLIWEGPTTLLSGGDDKVVKEWDFREGARLARSIRPMLWRGLAGRINDMALSPRADEKGQRLLAVAGFGVESRRGDITVFRLPGLTPSPTGEVVARLLPPRPGREIGHRDAVTCLAFDPAGKILASGSIDGTAILWDATRTVKVDGVDAFPPISQLVGHTRGIRRLAFLPGEPRRLATGGEDGTLRLWDVAGGKQLDQTAVTVRRPPILNALAVSPDGVTIVVGREDGILLRFDARNLRIAGARLTTLTTQGSIESLTFHPDGKRLIASIMSDRPTAIDPMTIACHVEVRSMPGGEVLHRRAVPGLVYACSLSPDGRRLAYTGGMSQAISIQDLDNLGVPPLELMGKGSTPFDLGFGPGDRVLGFTREHDPARPPATYEGFEPATRRATAVPRASLRRAIGDFGGWTIRGNLREYRLEAVHADGRRWQADIHPGIERYWWSHTMIPPGPGHPRPTVAIGCETGVVIYDLETGRRTRMFAGHQGAVVSVVPSRDGHWLASSSLDQTIMLYPLAGCDARPGLGATFRRGDDRAWSVAAVAPGSFAAGMGLKPDDVVLEAGAYSRVIDAAGSVVRELNRYKTPEQIGAFVTRVLDEVGPNDDIGIRVRRKPPAPDGVEADEVANLPSSKRDGPALALMQDVSREWVFWTPQGYYDTSIEGDTRLLGWHLNPPYDQSRPTDFVPIGAYPTLYKPAVLERLWATRSLEQALAVVPPAVAAEDRVAEETPPRITFEPAGPGLGSPAHGAWDATVPRPRIRLRLSAEGKAALGEVQVVLDGRSIGPRRAVGPGRDHEEILELDLPPGRRVRLLVTASNDRRAARSESIDLVFQAPQPPAPPARRLIVLGLGAGVFAGGGLPGVPFAEDDAGSLADFLARHIVAADGARPGPPTANGPGIRLGRPATTGAVREDLARLTGLLRKEEIGRGDVVAVVVTSHVLEFPDGGLPRIASADALAGDPGTMIPARELSEVLGELADYGCRVVMLLDGVHEGSLPPPIRADVKAWVRDLQQNRRVIVLLAAKEGPNGVSQRQRHGLFALGVVNAIRAARAAGARVDRLGSYSFDQFRAGLEREVSDGSDRQQEPGVFLPPGVPPWAPFVSPGPARKEDRPPGR